MPDTVCTFTPVTSCNWYNGVCVGARCLNVEIIGMMISFDRNVALKIKGKIVNFLLLIGMTATRFWDENL